MTMIGNLPPQLAGAAGLMSFSPSWKPSPSAETEQQDDRAPGYLATARAAAIEKPQNAIAQARLAQSAQAAGQKEEAITAANEALSLGLDTSNAPVVHAAIALLEAESQTLELARLLDDPRSSRLPTNLRLRAAIAASDYAGAISILSDPGAANEMSADAWAMLTWLYIQQHEFAKAIAAGRHARADGASGPILLANLGYAHAAIGQLKKGIRLTRQAHALAPKHRGVALNLALFWTLDGQPEAALAVLEEIQMDGHTDVQVALAMANVEIYSEHVDRARRILQRVRASSEWAIATDNRRAELEANLALLRWRTGKSNSHTAITSMRRALIATDYESLSIGYLLANLLLSDEHATLLSSLIERLATRHQETELEGLRMALALLEHDGDRAVELAINWAHREVLNPNAAAHATHLIGELRGDFAEASNVGLAALRRAPSHVTLINNTAFSLAFAGRVDEARRLIGRVDSSCQRVEIVATRALVKLMGGRVEEGLEGYQHAWQLACSSRDEPLADLVVANALAACAHLELKMYLPDADLLARLVSRSASQPGAWMMVQRLERELGVSLSPADPTGMTHGGLSSAGVDATVVNISAYLDRRTDTPHGPRYLLAPPKDQ